MKCKLNKEYCEIRDKQLGDCEVLDEDSCNEDGMCSGWRCPNYIEESK
jgi:hypothetical protein